MNLYATCTLSEFWRQDCTLERSGSRPDSGIHHIIENADIHAGRQIVPANGVPVPCPIDPASLIERDVLTIRLSGGLSAPFPEARECDPEISGTAGIERVIDVSSLTLEDVVETSAEALSSYILVYITGVFGN
jgi:hypothetical protein